MIHGNREVDQFAIDAYASFKMKMFVKLIRYFEMAPHTFYKADYLWVEGSRYNHNIKNKLIYADAFNFLHSYHLSKVSFDNVGITLLNNIKFTVNKLHSETSATGSMIQTDYYTSTIYGACVLVNFGEDYIGEIYEIVKPLFMYIPSFHTKDNTAFKFAAKLESHQEDLIKGSTP